MGLPLLAALAPSLIGAIGGMIGDRQAAGESAEVTAFNRKTALENYYDQIEAKKQAEQFAEGQLDQTNLGQTDAAGNRVYFDPERGWVTELSDEQKFIQRGSEIEQQRQLRDDNAANARIGLRTNEQRGDAGIRATESDREGRAVTRGDQGSLRDLLIARGQETRNQSADRTGEMIARQGIRSGGRNAAELVNSARAGSDATSARQAGVDAELQSRSIVDQEFRNERNDANSLLDYFTNASRGGQSQGQAYDVRGPQADRAGRGQLVNTITGIKGSAPQKGFNSVDPNVGSTAAGFGNALGGIGGSLLGLYKDQQSLDAGFDPRGGR